MGTIYGTTLLLDGSNHPELCLDDFTDFTDFKRLGRLGSAWHGLEQKSLR